MKTPKERLGDKWDARYKRLYAKHGASPASRYARGRMDELFKCLAELDLAFSGLYDDDEGDDA